MEHFNKTSLLHKAVKTLRGEKKKGRGVAYINTGIKDSHSVASSQLSYRKIINARGTLH